MERDEKLGETYGELLSMLSNGIEIRRVAVIDTKNKKYFDVPKSGIDHTSQEVAEMLYEVAANTNSSLEPFEPKDAYFSLTKFDVCAVPYGHMIFVVSLKVGLEANSDMFKNHIRGIVASYKPKV